MKITKTTKARLDEAVWGSQWEKRQKAVVMTALKAFFEAVPSQWDAKTEQMSELGSGQEKLEKLIRQVVSEMFREVT